MGWLAASGGQGARFSSSVLPGAAVQHVSNAGCGEGTAQPSDRRWSEDGT